EDRVLPRLPVPRHPVGINALAQRGALQGGVEGNAVGVLAKENALPLNVSGPGLRNTGVGGGVQVGRAAAIAGLVVVVPEVGVGIVAYAVVAGGRPPVPAIRGHAVPADV